MKEAIRSYLMQNKELIHEELEYAAKESFSVSENGGCEGEKISVVLTTDFELKTIRHSRRYDFSTDVLYVLNSFECETYIVDYDDVLNFLTFEQVAEFEKYLLAKAENLIKLKNDELDEFNELSKAEKLREVSYYISENSLVLELFEEFDKNLYEDYLKNVYDGADTSMTADLATDRMFDNLSEFEQI